MTIFITISILFYYSIDLHESTFKRRCFSFCFLHVRYFKEAFYSQLVSVSIMGAPFLMCPILRKVATEAGRGVHCLVTKDDRQKLYEENQKALGDPVDGGTPTVRFFHLFPRRWVSLKRTYLEAKSQQILLCGHHQRLPNTALSTTGVAVRCQRLWASFSASD